jgi:predicted NBD/HSP70 family sugar kinase
MKVLVIDVGGTNIKIRIPGRRTIIKIPSGPRLTPRRMVQLVRTAVAGSDYSVVSIGYPGPVVRGRPVREPMHLARGWVRFDFQKAFGCPVRVINDAAMQALGSYQGGHMLFLGLGTGLGSALITDGVVSPLELAHLPYKRDRTYEDYVGKAGLERAGKKKWRRYVADIARRLGDALVADYVVLGGGNAKLLRQLPPGTRLGTNSHAFIGGVRLWTMPHAKEHGLHVR